MCNASSPSLSLPPVLPRLKSRSLTASLDKPRALTLERLLTLAGGLPCRTDEPYGPVVVCGLIFVAVLLNFILRVRHRSVSSRARTTSPPARGQPRPANRPGPSLRAPSLLTRPFFDYSQGRLAGSAVAQEPVVDERRDGQGGAEPARTGLSALRKEGRKVLHGL